MLQMRAPGIIISAYIDSRLVGSNPLKESGEYRVAVNVPSKIMEKQ